MKINRINLGEIIRIKVEEQGLSKAKFAEKVGIARQNIEKVVFQKNSIDTNLLCTISEVLECNFFDYYKCDSLCNKLNYKSHEIKATLTIEIGDQKQDKTIEFTFGENNIEILNK